MMDLNRALGDISSIRRQVARSTEFRGYGPATLALTGGFAVLAAMVQAIWIADPAHQIGSYLAVWISTAIASASLIAAQTVTRTHRIHSEMADEMIRMAVEQFLPSSLAGALLTVVVVRSVPSDCWMLPGLWQLTFSLGVFSSCRFLPRPMMAAGVWYLFASLICIGFGDARALSPWAMGTAYGVGQMLVAAILFFCRQDNDEE